MKSWALCSALIALAPATAIAQDFSVGTVTGSPSSVVAGDALSAAADLLAAPSYTGSVDCRFYLSSDTTVDASDFVGPNTSVLFNGGTASAAANFTITAILLPGDYHVLAQIDPNNAITESNEMNNVGASVGMITVR